MKRIFVFISIIVISLLFVFVYKQISLAQTSLINTESSVTGIVIPTVQTTITLPPTSVVGSDSILPVDTSSTNTILPVDTIIPPDQIINNTGTDLLVPVSTSTNDYIENIILDKIVIEPFNPTVYIGEKIIFKAISSGNTLGNVTWIIAEEEGGLIDSSGIYTAPKMVGLFHVMAKTVDNPSLFGITTINVRFRPVIATTTLASTTIFASTTVITPKVTRTIIDVSNVSTSTSSVPNVGSSTIIRNSQILPDRRAILTGSSTVIFPQISTSTEANIMEIKRINSTFGLIRKTIDTANRVEKFQVLGGDLLYKDSNGDGISDFDSVNVYNLDPVKPSPVSFYEGRKINAGEKVLLGYDPREESIIKVRSEEPKNSMVEETKDYIVGEVRLNNERRLMITGQALPNSYITIYIYSTPIIVTVKTNALGEWAYTLDKELNDGRHEIYTATVNNTGKILAKSSPFGFVKTAEAAALENLPPVQISPESMKPEILSARNIYLIAGLLIIIFIFALIMIGSSSHKDTELSV